MALTNRLFSLVIADVICVGAGGRQKSFDVFVADIDARAKVFQPGLGIRRLLADVEVWFEPVSGALDTDLDRRTRATRQRHQLTTHYVVDRLEIH